MCLASGCGATARAEHTDEREIRASLDRLAQAWNSANADEWAKEYWSDGELINILGVLYSGPTNIGARTAEILAGPFHGSHFGFAVRSIRFIGADSVVADTDITITDFRGLPGIQPTRPGELVSRMKHVYARRQGIWRIAASQNTAVAPMKMLP